MVRPQLEYCSSVWSPYTKEYIQKIEMVQHRAAMYVTIRYHNTSSVTSLLEHLEWETLESRRTKNQLIMFFKIVHGLVDIPADKYLTSAFTQTRSRHSLKYKFPFPVTTTSTASFLKQFVFGIPFQPQCRSTKTRDEHNVCDVIVTGFLSTVTAMSRVVTGNCHGFCWYHHRNFSARNFLFIQ